MFFFVLIICVRRSKKGNNGFDSKIDSISGECMYAHSWFWFILSLPYGIDYLLHSSMRCKRWLWYVALWYFTCSPKSTMTILLNVQCAPCILSSTVLFVVPAVLFLFYDVTHSLAHSPHSLFEITMRFHPVHDFNAVEILFPSGSHQNSILNSLFFDNANIKRNV